MTKAINHDKCGKKIKVKGITYTKNPSYSYPNKLGAFTPFYKLTTANPCNLFETTAYNTTPQKGLITHNVTSTLIKYQITQQIKFLDKHKPSNYELRKEQLLNQLLKYEEV